ncbi:hypothetical protein CPU12_02895 [Malaciobacter molluscorum LMG 25693]|uniref:Membrane protein n=1 Tax=Malaciobacter molluscorum LMG 25693 TaxID=870501 RepID=A0A2G1DK10_9BACT|nr:hypothetical protein [Malaciobacter molluscorum]AXX91431.1 putative membrane protein [Malaciobacter molluscorum LMG 25693]PHO18822.1 hypothetical protein CPU12_02895 [Malaciobacter molluscorum LMG 25693]
MLNIVYKKQVINKLFMLTAFCIFSLVMYQGHIQKGGIYSILMYLTFLLIAFQIASIFYVIFVKRRLELNIDEKIFSWKVFDNKRVSKEININLEDIKQTKTEINYLTGNIYSNFTITFILNNDAIIELTDGILYDIGLEKAEDISTYLLNHNLGNTTDIEFANLIKELNIDITKEQKFTTKDKKTYILGVISKNKKEFLALRLQIEANYLQYNSIKRNNNNEYLVENPNIKDSYIHLKANPIGYMIKFQNIDKKPDFKMLKEFKGATIKNKLTNIMRAK